MWARGNAIHSETQLIQRAQANDRAAFNEIVLRYKGKVYNYISRMVASTTDAEDLTQETFVRAYVSIHTFQSRASLNTWLFRIATNLCIDFNRKTKTHIQATSLVQSQTDEEEGDLRDAPDVRFDPQRMVINKELGTEVERALSLLPEKLRIAVLLYDIEGLSYDEISGIVSAPLGTVKSRIFNARVQMRDTLSPYLKSNPLG